jgi:DNA-directed RNA polymerase subunit RPC12/RpoP
VSNGTTDSQRPPAPAPTDEARACLAAVPDDDESVCPHCDTQMKLWANYYRCPNCGYKESCCF